MSDKFEGTRRFEMEEELRAELGLDHFLVFENLDGGIEIWVVAKNKVPKIAFLARNILDLVDWIAEQKKGID